ncbi:peptidyl-prolyl cis-trans isomerase [Acidipila sp. EB88]|uniref:peptidylprolyl isomerase n=1 Tax=Acidipila sp. EB88 TaxID=2305226 RepID=UPI00131525C2|nr:peptidyl-prolyl cis-trans isomerase [Acidipila sp. EB88]
MALLINQDYVADDVFFAEFQHLGGLNIDPRHPGAQHETRTLRQLAERRVASSVLLRQRARAQGIGVTAAEVEARRQEQWGTSSASVCGAGVWKAIGDHLLVEKYCQWVTRHEPRPSRAEVEDFYRSHREQFRVEERVRVQQVIRNIELPQDEAAAEAAMLKAEQELAAGRPFREVAERYSDCGGRIDLGWVARGEMVAAFEDAVFAMARSQRTGIFRTVFGLHLAIVLEHRPAGYQPFEDVRMALAKQMLERRREQRVQAEIAEALRTATITVAPEAKAEELA